MEACLRLGIDPSTLAQRPLEYFMRTERNAELAQLAFNYEEKLRQARDVAGGRAGIERKRLS